MQTLANEVVARLFLQEDTPSFLQPSPPLSSPNRARQFQRSVDQSEHSEQLRVEQQRSLPFEQASPHQRVTQSARGGLTNLGDFRRRDLAANHAQRRNETREPTLQPVQSSYRPASIEPVVYPPEQLAPVKAWNASDAQSVHLCSTLT